MARSPMPWLVPAVAVGGAAPVLLLIHDALVGDLGANPVNTGLKQLGLLSLVALLATLACTPLLRFATWPARVRRTLGVLAFVYVTLHLLTYIVLDLGLKLGTLGDDVLKRPFITVGFTAWLLLVPLAVTSTDGMVRRLGFVRWKRLHRLSYLCAALGVLHFVWSAKKDVSEPVAYAAVLGGLLVARLVPRGKKG